MTVTERFLNYTAFDTQSSEESQSTPSTPGQMVFAQYLAEELKREGLHDIVLDEKGYVYATLPGNVTKDLPTIGFIAHYDISPDCSGKGVKPRIVEHYDGGDITLSEGIVLSPSVFPELLVHKGEDLIVTDGHTLLGADDKAGIAEIVQAMAWLREHPEVKHGKIRIAFTPDEEIGRGADHFDVDGFGCQWAYTMDGGDVGELEYENFNAASAKVTLRGVSVHPGYAKGKMVNASLLAMEFAMQLPADERPENTEGYEGFFHVTGIGGHVGEASLSLIIRDHDYERFDKRKKLVTDIAATMNRRYGEGTVSVEMHDQYYNMKELVVHEEHVVELALEAMRRAGVKPKVQPIRGGTDGAQLSFKGLPCPNIFAGGLNFHGPYEFIPVQSMEKAVRVIVGICQLLA
jgi:tripeptide aminopeptidase